VKLLTDELESILQREKTICTNEEEYQSLNSALESYNKMVQSGVLTPRGNQLMDNDERFRQKSLYNTTTN